VQKKKLNKSMPKARKLKQGKQTESRKDKGMASDRPTRGGRGQADWT
jgi:hypothetical protein